MNKDKFYYSRIRKGCQHFKIVPRPPFFPRLKSQISDFKSSFSHHPSKKSLRGVFDEAIWRSGRP